MYLIEYKIVGVMCRKLYILIFKCFHTFFYFRFFSFKTGFWFSEITADFIYRIYVIIFDLFIYYFFV